MSIGPDIKELSCSSPVFSESKGRGKTGARLVNELLIEIANLKSSYRIFFSY
jgi:hypothetical protein